MASTLSGVPTHTEAAQGTSSRLRFLLRFSLRVSLRFSDDAKEAKYQAWRFNESYPLVLSSSFALALFHLLRAVAFVELRQTACIVSCAIGLLVLLRVWCVHLGQVCFAWLVFGFHLVTAVAVVTQHMLHQQAKVEATAMYVAFLLNFGRQALVTLAGVPLVPRVLCLVVALSITPLVTLLSSKGSMSALGQPTETILVGSALLLAEIGHYPFERFNRNWFLKHELMGDLPTVRLHPITLRLLNETDEREFVTRRFSNSHRSTIRVLGILSLLMMLNVYAHPRLRFNCSCNVGCLCGLVLMRTRLTRVKDQYRAYQLFSWGTVGGMTLTQLVKFLAQRWLSDANVAARGARDLPPTARFSVVAVRSLILLYWRFLGLGSLHRQLVIAMILLWLVFSSPLTLLFQPDDARVLQAAWRTEPQAACPHASHSPVSSCWY